MKKEKAEKPLKGFGVRLDASKMDEAHYLGIDISELFRKALDKAILAAEGKCPTCGKKN